MGKNSSPGSAARIAGILAVAALVFVHPSRLRAETTPPEPEWTPTTLGWGSAGAGAVEADNPAGDRSFALLGTDLASAGKVRAAVEIRESLNDRWKVAGVAWRADDGSFWHLALVEAPPDAGGRRYVELSEAYEGVWLAQYQETTRLTPLPTGSAPLAWEPNRPYTLTLTISPDRIVGTVEDEAGKPIARVGFRLDGPAVACGTPALTCQGFRAVFTDIDTVRETPCSREIEPVPAFPADAGYPEIRGEPGGFFRVEQIDGVWWLLTPSGNGFFALGTDHVNSEVHWCETLGFAPYARNIRRKYDNDLRAWAASTVQRLRSWGFTSLGLNTSPLVRHAGLPHMRNLKIGETFAGRHAIAARENWTGFPDVFDPEWEEHCRIVAERVCRPERDDPWLLGWFLDNELEWFGKNHRATGLADAVFSTPAQSACRRAFADFLRERYETIDHLDAAWNTAWGSWEEMRLSREVPPPTAESIRDRTEFVRLIARRYFEIACRAIREADGNHLVFGCRFAGEAPDVVDIAGRNCDVVSFNLYPRVDLIAGTLPEGEKKLREWHRRAGRPLMITEWGFRALDSGLPCTEGAGETFDTQAQRARAFEIMQTTLMRLPFVVGSDFFMWVDEPAEGISSAFPENSNYGLVDVNDDPYEELVRTASRVNRTAAHVHRTGAPPPLRLSPEKAAALIPGLGETGSATGTAGHDVRVQRTGDGFLLDNGRLRLVRNAGSGRAFDGVYIDGTPLGSFYPLIHERIRQDLWVEPDSVEPDSLLIDPLPDGGMAVEMTFRKTPGGPALARIDLEGNRETVEETPRAWRCRFRFVIPPGKPYFTSRCLWVENTDLNAWELAGIYHFALPRIGGASEGDVSTAVPPNFYIPAALWRDETSHAAYGIVSPDLGTFYLSYWIDPEGGFHADAVQPLEILLQPGERWLQPSGAVLYVIGVPSSAHPDAWKAVAAGLALQPKEPAFRLDAAQWRDRLLGGWAGQMIGVSYGAPWEFKSLGKIIETDLPPYNPDSVAGAFEQDDLYLEAAFLERLDRYGLHLTPDRAAEAWAETDFRVWHGNRAARANLDKGIRPPLTGSPVCNPHWQDIDFQIESDLFGLIHPGCPEAARDVASRFGVVVASGDGLYGGLYVAGLYALAYVEPDRVRLVERALEGIPPESDYARAIRDVLGTYREDPGDWRRAWRMLQERWDGRDVCRSGRGKPFNISATINGAYATIGLLYGGGDFWKTAEIAVRCGQDADCNASTACGVLGVMKGFSGLPREATAPFRKAGSRVFEGTSLDFDAALTICRELVPIAVRRAGGRVEGETLLLP